MNTHRIVNDTDLPAPLPLRVVPYHDEDLLSVLRRSASRMGYPDVRWLLRPTQGNWFLDEADIPLLSAEEDYHVLGSLLLLTREELHNHTLHRFTRLLESGESPRQSPGQDPASTHLQQMNPGLREAYFLPVRSLRVCPLCLREPVCYDRLYWRMRLIFYCPQHRVRLLEKCPSCKAPIAASTAITARSIPLRFPLKTPCTWGNGCSWRHSASSCPATRQPPGHWQVLRCPPFPATPI